MNDDIKLFLNAREVLLHVRALEKAFIASQVEADSLAAKEGNRIVSYKQKPENAMILGWFLRIRLFFFAQTGTVLSISSLCIWVVIVNYSSFVDPKYHFVWLLHLLSVFSAFAGALAIDKYILGFSRKRPRKGRNNVAPSSVATHFESSSIPSSVKDKCHSSEKIG